MFISYSRVDSLFLQPCTAHCFFNQNVKSITAYVNATASDFRKFNGGEVQRRVIAILPHPRFSGRSIDPDIMLLKLESKVVGITPLRINIQSGVPAEKQRVTIIGLGSTTFGGSPSEKLLEAGVDIVGIDDCNDENSYQNILQGDRQICATAQGKGACQGDSGSPLLYRNGNGNLVQVGLTSFGRGCDDIQLPPVYTRVSFYYQGWILPNLCKLASNPPQACNTTTYQKSITTVQKPSPPITRYPTLRSPPQRTQP